MDSMLRVTKTFYPRLARAKHEITPRISIIFPASIFHHLFISPILSMHRTAVSPHPAHILFSSLFFLISHRRFISVSPFDFSLRTLSSRGPQLFQGKSYIVYHETLRQWNRRREIYTNIVLYNHSMM